MIALSIGLYCVDKYLQLYDGNDDWFKERNEKDFNVYRSCKLNDDILQAPGLYFPKLITIGSVWKSGLQLMGTFD